MTTAELFELFRNARHYDRGPAAFLLYRAFRDRLELLSRQRDLDDYLLMRECRRSRDRMFPVDLPPLSMLSNSNPDIACGGAILLPGTPAP